MGRCVGRVLPVEGAAMTEPDRSSERRLGQLSSRVASERARLRSESVGALVHDAVRVALGGGGRGDPGEAARMVVSRGVAPVYRLALLHRVTTATGAYLGALRRDPASWSIMGAEVLVGEARLDLLFVDPGGRIEADEIKTGLLGPAAELPWVRAQVEAQVGLGRATFGRRFGGVRLVDLARRQATLFEADRWEGGCGRAAD